MKVTKGIVTKYIKLMYYTKNKTVKNIYIIILLILIYLNNI